MRRMVLLLVVLGACTPAYGVTTAPTTPAPKPTSLTSSGWEVFCGYSHSAFDDPIVFPGRPGASHLHDFLGNTSTNASSTYASLLAAGTTCSPATEDTAAYWTPALLRNGSQVAPATSTTSRSEVYYRNNLTGLPASSIRTIPPGLRMVVGNARAVSVADNPKLGKELYYGCSNNSPDVKATAPINCTTGTITIHVGFPNCWDGANLDTVQPDGLPAKNPVTGATYPNNHLAHMAWPISSNGYRCPADHPVPIPRIIFRWEYPLHSTSSSGITLASGQTYTLHGDFFNAWDQPTLDRLVADCLDKQMSCGSFRL